MNEKYQGQPALCWDRIYRSLERWIYIHLWPVVLPGPGNCDLYSLSTFLSYLFLCCLTTFTTVFYFSNKKNSFFLKDNI